MEIKLDEQKLSALNNEVRRKILGLLDEKESYPKEIADKLSLSKQKTHYHLKQLHNSGLIKTLETEKRNKYYRKNFEKAVYGKEPSNSSFLEKLPKKGLIVVGSPDQHGSDHVRARDGHLAGEIGIKLGKMGMEYRTVWDTEVKRDGLFEDPMIILGGVMTNTVAKKFNERFPAYFSGESFPYREITTPKTTYTDPDIGVISKKDDKVMVAGIRNSGTKAAVKAFQELEEEKDYIVVKGLDLDGDGEIDDYEVIE